MSSHKRLHHEEYRDPDYPSTSTAAPASSSGAADPAPTAAKRAKIDAISLGHPDALAPLEADANRGPAVIARIAQIVRREFATELAEREQEVNLIERRLQQCKRLLQRVRYAVVYDFYTNKRLVFTETADSRHEQSVSVAEDAFGADGAPPALAECTGAVVPPPVAAAATSLPPPLLPLPQQTAVHPSLKKLLGTNDIDYNEILKVRPARQAATDAKHSIREKLRTKKELRRLRMAAAPPLLRQQDTTTPAPATPTAAAAAAEQQQRKIPRYISPIKSTAPDPFGQISTARGSMRNAQRLLVAVGNTSKYIADDCDPMTRGNGDDGVTHKWLVYVKCKAPAEYRIEEMVQKVRFFLHPSYKPNDVVDVSAGPFQLARRGWGEFPIRVQLFFYAHVQQKPLQIFHNLVLDKKLTGLETMGAETVVEMWLTLPQKEQQLQPTVAQDEPRPSTSAAALRTAATPLPDVKPPQTPKKETPQAPVALETAASSRSPSAAAAAVTTVAEPCWDPDGLIKSVQISEAEQNSLMAMAEESKRFGLHTTLSPSTQASAALLLSMSPHLNGGCRPNGSAAAMLPTTPSRRPLPAAMAAGVVVSNAARKIVIKSEPSPLINTAVADAARPPNAARVTITMAPNVPKSTAPKAAAAAVTNNVPISIVPARVQPAAPTPATTAPATPAAAGPVRKFVKCLNTAGKVVMVEVQTDPNNPKNIRIVRNNNNNNVVTSKPPSTPSLPSTSPVAAAASAASAVAPTIRASIPTAAAAAATSTAASASAPPRIFVLPKGAVAPTKAPQLIKLEPSTNAPQLIKLEPTVARAAAAVVAPTTPSATPVQPSPFAGGTKKVLLKNGQMFIIDTSKFVSRPIPQASASNGSPAPAASVPPAKPPSISATSAVPGPSTAAQPAHPKPKQQSLLKPQISLLKPKLTKAAAAPAAPATPSTPSTPIHQPGGIVRGIPAQMPGTSAGPTIQPGAPFKFAIKPIAGSSSAASLSAPQPRQPGFMLPFVRKGGTLVRVPMPPAAGVTPTTTAPASASAAATPTFILARNPAHKLPTTPSPLPLPLPQHFRQAPGGPIRAPFPTIVLPPEKSLFNSASAASASAAAAQQRRLLAALQPPPQAARIIDYAADLEQRFLARSPFRTQRAAVEFLLRNVPLVHRLAGSGTSTEFGRAFPFIVDAESTFEAYTWPKQRCVEWLRAKFVARLLAKAPQAVPTPPPPPPVARKAAVAGPAAVEEQQQQQQLQLQQQRCVWTTKEIVLFARRFGYSLPLRSPKAVPTTTSEAESTSRALSKLIKREIKRSECEPDATITGGAPLTAWMETWQARRSRRKQRATAAAAAVDEEEPIDVVTTTDVVGGEAAVENGRRRKRPAGKRRPRGLYPLPAAVRTEAGWIADVCGQVQVRLQPEEIVDDILHPSSQLVLVTAVHRFVSDLLHRAYASKPEADRNSATADDRVVRVEDVRRSIVSAAHFDFLTNRHLGSQNATSSSGSSASAAAATEPSTTIKKERSN